MEIGIHEAKTKLSKLIPAVLSGEEVIITKSGHPLVKLVPVKEAGEKRKLGVYSGKMTFHEDFDAPLPDDILNDFWPGPADDALSS
jgi:prevent-host-death family protein